MTGYRIDQLLDIEQVRRLLESHHRLSQMAYGVFDADGNEVIAVGWQDICVRFYRAHPVTCARCRESDAFIKAHLHDFEGEFLEYRCKNGMIDVAMPIIIDGEHAATFFSGQFFYEDDRPDLEYSLMHGEGLGFDLEEYLKALERVHVLSREHVRSNMLFLRDMVAVLARCGLNNLRFAREAEERKRVEEELRVREEEFRALAENTPDTIARYDRECSRLFANRAFAALAGMPEEELLGKAPTTYSSSPAAVEYEARIRGVFQSGLVDEYEFSWPDREGRQITSHVRIVPERNREGRIASVLCVGRDITEWKRYEAELLHRAKLQERLAAVAAAVPGFIFTIRVEPGGRTCFPFASDGIEDLFGIRPEEIRDDAAVLRARYHPDDLARHLELVAESGRTLAPFRIEIRVNHPDKGERWVEIRSNPQRQPDGATEWHGVMIDVTERKRMEALLAAREQYQRTLLDNFPFFVWLKDKESRLLAANQQYARVAKAGTTRELEGRTDFDFFPRDLAEKYVADDRAVMAGGAMKNVEEMYSDENGELHWMETWKSPVFVNGQVVGTVGCSHDITDRKRNEQMLLERAELERRQSQYFRVAPGYFYTLVLRPDGTLFVPFASDGVIDLYGLRPEVVTKDLSLFFSLCHPDDVEFTSMKMEQSAREMSPYHVEYRINHPEKGERWIEARSLPQREPDGSILWHGFMYDITTRKWMEKELQRKNSELERFTYTVSHDLKSPLITIKSFSGSIKSDLASGREDRIETDLNRICTAADKMAALLDDLLELSRVGRIVGAPEPVDMAALVREVLKNMEGVLNENGVQVAVHPELPTVQCDPQRMMEVVQNLVENAVKYRGDQTEPRIQVGLREEGGRRVFFIQDNGPGIEPKYHENIFGLFNRLDTRIPGTGIGLALVKRIIEVQGGSIWVESEGCGVGSTFCFTLK